MKAKFILQEVFMLIFLGRGKEEAGGEAWGKGFHRDALNDLPNGQNDLAPMTTLVLFGMNSNSSQLLDLLQALRLGQFFFFSFTYFKATHKKIYSIA